MCRRRLKTKEPILITVAERRQGTWKIAATGEVKGWRQLPLQLERGEIPSAREGKREISPKITIQVPTLPSRQELLTEDDYYDQLAERYGVNASSWPEDEDWLMMR